MIRIKWYHYYILLATFDVLVLSAGLWAQHRTLGSFASLLDRTAVLDAQQRDLTSLGLRLVALNAPGNDVFESRQVVAEKARFVRLRSSLELIRKTGHIEPGRLSDFWQEVDEMCVAEEKIFESIAKAQATADSTEAARYLADAGTFMSVMDKHQALAIKRLGREQERTMNTTADVLWTHQEALQRHKRLELFFVGAIFLALVGMFWFFWKLQKADAVLLAEWERIEAERRERLAAIGELCSSVAHGIQNPLASIRSSAELIVDMGRLDDQSRTRAQDVITECARLSTRVTRLLKFSRADGTSRRIINIVEALQEACTEVRAKFDEKDVAIKIDYDSTALLVLADPDELASIFIELLANAYDYSPRHELVKVLCRKASDRVIVDVVDRGPGVPDANANKIFDLFYTTKENGTGIGLASVKRIAESLGGRVELASTSPGAGSVFRLELPLVDPTAMQPDVEPTTAAS